MESKVSDQPSRLKLRQQCLSWALKVLKTIQVRTRTTEICCLLIDSLLMEKNFDVADPQVFCVACILFTLKLETDFDNNYRSFMQSVFFSLRISREKLLQKEVEILNILPPDFSKMPVLSELLDSLLVTLGVEEQNAAVKARLVNSLLNRYVEKGPQISYARLFTKPVMDFYFPIKEDTEVLKKIGREVNKCVEKESRGCFQEPAVQHEYFTLVTANLN